MHRRGRFVHQERGESVFCSRKCLQIKCYDGMGVVTGESTQRAESWTRKKEQKGEGCKKRTKDFAWPLEEFITCNAIAGILNGVDVLYLCLEFEASYVVESGLLSPSHPPGG